MKKRRRKEEATVETRALCPHHRSPQKRTWNLTNESAGLQGNIKTKDSQCLQLHCWKNPRIPPAQMLKALENSLNHCP
jgi:hypothetical protein